MFHSLGEFESDRIRFRESDKSGRNGAHGLNFIIYVNSLLIFEINDKNYPMKKISSLLYTFEIFVIFGIRPIFEISIDNFEYIAIYTAIFCVIIVENGVFLILIEFEIDQISPRESPKNGRICALSLN